MPVQVELLIRRLEGKDIHLPMREDEADRHIALFYQLLESGAISRECFEKEQTKIRSRTLDDETYDMFYDAICSGRCNTTGRL